MGDSIVALSRTLVDCDTLKTLSEVLEKSADTTHGTNKSVYYKRRVELATEISAL